MGDELPATEAVLEKRADRPPLWRRILFGLFVTFSVIVFLVATLYAFGGPSGSANDPQMKDRYEAMVASGEIEPVEQRFVIGIPGCRCHSDDPVLTEEHRNRRINECMGCHGGR